MADIRQAMMMRGGLTPQNMGGNDPMALANAYRKMIEASKAAHASLGRAGQSLSRAQSTPLPSLPSSFPQAAAPAAAGVGTISTGAGLGLIGGEAAIAAVLIDRAMKKTYGTGLLENISQGIKKPAKSAKSGIKLLKENL